MPNTQRSAIYVTAPARLHLGFLDLNGSMGRRFGSLGLALDQPVYRLRIASASRLHIQGQDAQRAEHHARKLGQQLGWPSNVHITIEQAIPAHVGLGSGTQLALAVGMGIARFYDIPTTPTAVAHVLGRGARSGIGIGAFEQGGFIMDGGQPITKTQVATPLASLPQTPPIISRIAFPKNWRVLLIFDRNRQGFSGGTERRAFTELPIFPELQAAHLCRLVLMCALPALIEADFSNFAEAISELQKAIGDYFAPVQGGRFTSKAVTAVLDDLVQRKWAGLGQSSWGPTGFVFCKNETEALQLRTDLKTRWSTATSLHFVIAKPRNQAAPIELHRNELQRTLG